MRIIQFLRPAYLSLWTFPQLALTRRICCVQRLPHQQNALKKSVTLTTPLQIRSYSTPVIQRAKTTDPKMSTKRIVRRKKSKNSPYRDQEVFDVLAYSTADKYNLESLRRDLEDQGLYGVVPLAEDMNEEALYVEAQYAVEDESRYIYFFKDGATVFWNMPEVERKAVLKFLRRHQEKPHAIDQVDEEYERMEYTYLTGPTDLNGDEIALNKSDRITDKQKQHSEKYAFSNALALSVSLSIWEATLDTYVESIEFILQDLKDGRKIRLSETDVLRKAGHLYTLRHLINLRSDLLDQPDAYWDREDLEQIYTKTYRYLEIARRTRVMNEKLNHCTELTTMLTELLKDKHHTRLEWMIIILIMIEVVFEIFHTYENRQESKHH